MRHFMKSSLRPAILKLRRHEDGVTLVELLLALVISSIFAGIVITVFLSGSLGFRLTNDTSSLRAEADYLVSSVMHDLNQTKFDAVTKTDDLYTFYVLTDPKVSSNGILYRENGYVDTGKTLSSTALTSSSNEVVLQEVVVSIVGAEADARMIDQTYYTSGLFEVKVTVAPSSNPSQAKTFTSTIPF